MLCVQKQRLSGHARPRSCPRTFHETPVRRAHSITQQRLFCKRTAAERESDAATTLSARVRRVAGPAADRPCHLNEKACTSAMGVQGLWPLLEPVGRRVNIEALTNKRLAVGASATCRCFPKAFLDAMSETERAGSLLQTRPYGLSSSSKRCAMKRERCCTMRTCSVSFDAYVVCCFTASGQSSCLTGQLQLSRSALPLLGAGERQSPSPSLPSVKKVLPHVTTESAAH